MFGGGVTSILPPPPFSSPHRFGFPHLSVLPSSPALYFSLLPSGSDCDGEVNPACIWLPLAADLPIKADGQCGLITIFDPRRNPLLAWL